jgi:hypothetical protein
MTAQSVTSLNETIDLSEKRLTALENRIPHHLANAAADCSHDLFHVWLLAAQEILAGGHSFAANDCDCHGIDRGFRQLAQRFPPRRSAQLGTRCARSS